MNKKYSIKNLENFNITFKKNESRVLLGLVVVLLIILLFRKVIGTIIEKSILFLILFLLFLVISKNLVVSLVASVIIFLLINVTIQYRDAIENFEDLDKSLLESDKKNDKDKVSSVSSGSDPNKMNESIKGIQELLKKVNGGIELKEDDLKETGNLNIDVSKYSDDNKFNPLKQAQKEAFELIDTVNALKDTINTLSPVLSQGKELMNIFQTLKF